MNSIKQRTILGVFSTVWNVLILIQHHTTIYKLPFTAWQKTSFKKLKLHSLATENICFDSGTISLDSNVTWAGLKLFLTSN